MTIWELLGFDINLKRIAKYNQKALEQQKSRIEGLVRDINYYGINALLKRNTYDIKDIKAVLTYFNEAPIRDADWEKYWPEAKKWLYLQEYREAFHLENDKEIIKDQQEQINK